MNSLPEINPAGLHAAKPDINYQNNSSHDEIKFASLVDREYTKSTDCRSHKKDLQSENAIKDDNSEDRNKPTCDSCASEINSEIHERSENYEQQETDGIGTGNRDEGQKDEGEHKEGLTTGALLYDLLHDLLAETGNAPLVSTGDGLQGLEDGGADVTESENGLRLGTILKDLIGSHSAESEETSGINYIKIANVELTGVVSGEEIAESHGESGLKLGELLDTGTGRSDEKGIKKDSIKGEIVSFEEAIEINQEAEETEADSLIFNREIQKQDESKKNISAPVEKIHSKDGVAAAEIPEHNDNPEGLNSRPISGAPDQFRQDAGTGEHAFRFARGQHKAMNEAETNNVNSINTSNAVYENARSVQSLSSLHSVKTPGVQELLDNVVYAIKGNNRMGVSVEHEKFGKLNISLTLEKGLVNVHINTSDRAVREIIENNIQHIIDTLNKDGVSVGEFSVALRDRKEQEAKEFTVRNGKAGEIQQDIKKEPNGSGLVNIFA